MLRPSCKGAAVWSAPHCIEISTPVQNKAEFVAVLFFFQKLFWFSGNGMQFLLSSLPFPQSLMQFLVMALWGELLMILQTWRNMLLTFPHPSGPGRETVGFFWPSVHSCNPPKDFCSVSWKKAGPHRARPSHLKIVAYGELSLFKISEKYLSPLAVCIYTRMGWTAS